MDVILAGVQVVTTAFVSGVGGAVITILGIALIIAMLTLIGIFIPGSRGFVSAQNRSIVSIIRRPKK